MQKKEYKLPNGKIAVFEYDVCKIGKITLECMDELMAMIANRPQGEVDAIDRDALIDYCLKLIDVERKQGSDVMNYGQERVNQTEAIINYIEHMPHVNADRQQGEWIKAKNDGVWAYAEVYAECDQCHKVVFNGWEMNYCPNCGSRMSKGADDE